jgi:3',5'-cyclic AMP phosphodiesterase CpdA
MQTNFFLELQKDPSVVLRWLASFFVDTKGEVHSWRQPNSYNTKAFSALTRFISNIGSSLDGLVITGDVSTTGLDGDLGFAFRCVDQELVQSEVIGSVQRGLGKFREKVFLLPGNHDQYQPTSGMPFWEPGGGLFAKTFSKYWSPSHDRVQFKDIFGDGSVYLVGADFCLNSKECAGGSRLDALGKGRVFPDRLAALIAVTAALRAKSPRSIVAWCIHFCPVHSGGRLELIEAPKLLEAAGASRVQLVLSGHIHTSKLTKLDNGVVLFRAGTATCIDQDQFLCHLLRIVVGDNDESPALEVRDAKFDGRYFQIEGKKREALLVA